MSNRFIKISRQRGMLMFELLIVLTVASFIMLMSMKKEKLATDQTRAQADGVMMAQINNAIRKRMSEEGSSMVAGIYTGVDWLHKTTCTGGLASKEYLPCEISGKFYYELSPVTTVTNSSGNVTSSTTFGQIKTGSQVRGDLANLAALAANNENIHGETPIAGTFFSYQVDSSGILSASSSYDSGLDQWLRTDGTNSMNADLDLGGNQITNLGSAVEGASCTGSGLIAQQSGAILSCVSGVWKKQGSEFWNDPVLTFASLPTTDPIGSVRITKNTGRAFRWNGSSWTAIAVDESGNFTVPGQTTSNSMVTSILYDKDNSGYYWNGNGTSRMNYAYLNVARLNNNYTAGSGCTSKQVGTTSTGELLSCVSGVWVKPGASGATVDNSSGYTKNFCPAGPFTISFKRIGSTIYVMLNNNTGYTPLRAGWYGFSAGVSYWYRNAPMSGVTRLGVNKESTYIYRPTVQYGIGSSYSSCRVYVE